MVAGRNCTPDRGERLPAAGAGRSRLGVAAAVGLLALAACAHSPAKRTAGSSASPSPMAVSPTPSPVATPPASPSPHPASPSPRPSPPAARSPSPLATANAVGSGTVITNANSGQTITLGRGAVAYLQLNNGLRWGEPTVTGNSVTLTPRAASPLPPAPGAAAEPALAPAGAEWEIVAVAPGQSTIRDSGGPICPTGPMVACPMFLEEFDVTINVV